MTDNFSNLPQDWSESLTPAATILTSKSALPYGEPLLDFTAMSGTTFEQFCWWLLQKDHSLVGCKRIGGQGKAQGGIDLFASDAQMPGALHVFECKAWNQFDTVRLSRAIDDFLNGPWASSTRTFTLIVAQHDLGGGALAKRWVDEQERLKRAGIHGEIWTAHTLTLRVQQYPDILSKFFPWHSVELFANQWMERVALHELVSKAFFDPRDRISKWAREQIALSTPSSLPATNGSAEDSFSSSEEAGDLTPSLKIDGVHRLINRHGNNWHFKGPWFSISAIIPDQLFTRASIAISFTRPDMEGITLTVGHEWLLKKLLFGGRAPLAPEYREFIVGQSVQSPDHYVIDLPNCRINLQAEGTQEIAGVAAILTDVIRDALLKLESAWHAVDFPFVKWAGNKVALAAVDKRVWREIGRFVEAHDVDDGSTPWHMFDSNRDVLKPFHNHRTEQFDRGYHAIVYATEIDRLSYGGEVVLMWQPDDRGPDHAFSPRGDWSCEYTLQWLSTALMPAVKQWVYEREFNSKWKRLWNAKQAQNFKNFLDEIFVIRDLRTPPLMRDGAWCSGVVESVKILQSFFTARGALMPFIRRHEMEALFRTLTVVAQGERGYVGFVRSSLGLRSDVSDHAGLIAAIDEHIREARVGLNSTVADYALRAMLEMLPEHDAQLSKAEQTTIKASLVPFAKLHDDAVLVDRHTKWS